MRHNRTVKKIGSNASHRKSILSNLAGSLFLNKRIVTTLAKAKAAKSFIERMITHAKKGTLSARRLVLQYVHNKSAVKTLFTEVAPTYANRNGGYTRVIKLGNRHGDGAPLSILELVGFELSEEAIEKKMSAKEKRKKKKEEKEKAKTQAPPPPSQEQVAQETKEEKR
jgi:large subunit ribosomal protein L17